MLLEAPYRQSARASIIKGGNREYDIKNIPFTGLKGRNTGAVNMYK